MTVIVPLEVKCAVCGTSTTQHGLVSTNEFGSRDLDLRPAQMMRSTMHNWVQQCPNCGLCATSVDKVPAGTAELVRSTRYQALLRDATRMPQLARRFRAQSLMEEQVGDLVSAAHAALCAAWACDDARETDAAIDCRNRAIGLFLRAADSDQPSTDGSERDGRNLVVIDLLRRTSRFDEARARCQLVLEAADPSHRAIAQYQATLVDAADTAVHRVDEAKLPETKLPKVTKVGPLAQLLLAQVLGFVRRLIRARR